MEYRTCVLGMTPGVGAPVDCQIRPDLVCLPRSHGRLPGCHCRRSVQTVGVESLLARYSQVQPTSMASQEFRCHEKQRAFLHLQYLGSPLDRLVQPAFLSLRLLLSSVLEPVIVTISWELGIAHLAAFWTDEAVSVRSTFISSQEARRRDRLYF